MRFHDKVAGHDRLEGCLVPGCGLRLLGSRLFYPLAHPAISPVWHIVENGLLEEGIVRSWMSRLSMSVRLMSGEICDSLSGD